MIAIGYAVVIAFGVGLFALCYATRNSPPPWYDLYLSGIEDRREWDERK